MKDFGKRHRRHPLFRYKMVVHCEVRNNNTLNFDTVFLCKCFFFNLKAKSVLHFENVWLGCLVEPSVASSLFTYGIIMCTTLYLYYSCVLNREGREMVLVVKVRFDRLPFPLQLNTQQYLVH